MARRFRVTFDLEFSYDIDPSGVAQDVSDLLDAEETDHTEVVVTVLDPHSQADGASLDDVL